jgi:hypothetical protein
MNKRGFIASFIALLVLTHSMTTARSLKMTDVVEKIEVNNNNASGERFGQQLLPLFMLNPQYRNINHGSYGSVPRSVIYSKNQYIE